MDNLVAGETPGGLRRTLLDHGIAVTREFGPDALSLRDVQRRAGVSNAAAYRHFAGRKALLAAVSDYASALMAERLEAVVGAVPPQSDAAATALAALRASGEAYLRFAVSEPGLFRALFLSESTDGNYQDPASAARSSSGSGPFQVLQRQIDALVATGVLAPERRPHSDVAAWSAVHGLAVLFLDGPLRQLPEPELEVALARLLDVVLAGMR